MTDDFAFATIAEIRAAYRNGRTTPVAVTEAALRRAASLEPRLNAVVTLLRDTALREAEAAGRDLATGRDRGPLHGIPVAVKDLIDVAGAPTTFATQAVDPVWPARDATLVRHLREAGAVILAKTNLLEFAYGIAHPAIGQTNNPWDTGRTSGGSSGGSAALVAAGVVPAAVGTDTGGSIRIPASYCGIVGVKPSFGLVSTDGIFPLSQSLDHAGPIARTVADAATLLAGMTGRAMPVVPRAPAALRIGVVAAHRDSPLVTPGVRSAFLAALNRLAAAGVHVTEVGLPGLNTVNDALMNVLLPEAALVHETLAASRPDGYAPGTAAQIKAGAAVSGLAYLRAQASRARLRAVVEHILSEVDVLLSPAVAFVAPREDPALDAEGGDGEMLSSGLANVTGHPALSLPCGLSDGLPVGLQLIAKTDSALLSCATSIETILAFDARPDLKA
ncbi:amidase [Lichenihabitans sp. Uapishka_5]|uniref:amidase n=1 Tax=Lichenihabitans sp. Uapishka_5 TaxID=3037302 RepID=UPI0029E7FFC1|nr:amidase [Lichenihabitans sp. Uapishka_5]MDX7950511.1 amidase [Lichenihabitans sp. Uapishka_5]